MAQAKAFISTVGGKARQGNWIIASMPRDIALYVEPFCGGATVMLNRKPSGTEVLNDIDQGVTALFRLLRDCDTEELYRLLWLTPYSRNEYARSKQPIPEDASDEERARTLFVRYNQAFGGLGQNNAYKTPHTDGGWGISKIAHNGDRSVNTGVWIRRIDRLYQVVERLRQVQVECRPALRVLREYDRDCTVFFVDPPYLPSTMASPKSSRTLYVNAMTREDHEELLEVLVGLKSMVLLSGYDSPMYEQTLVQEHGWSVDKKSYNSNLSGTKRANTPRIEALWSNPALVAAMGYQLPLL